MPIRELVRALDPAPPAEIREAAERLRYRDFLTVGLVVDRDELFPDNWIYVHSDEVKLGRIQNFKNWSPDMVPDPTKSFLGLEYFVQEDDEIWSASDEDLVALGTRECAKLGLIEADEVVDGTVVRMPKAYPVYDGDYREALELIRAYVDPISNLQLIGRNGQHRYNNQDHSMMTAVYAARNIAGAQYDVWDVNVEAEYHEEVLEKDELMSDRLVPQLVAEVRVEQKLREAFARYDPVALGGAVGSVLSLGLFLATVLLLLPGVEGAGPTLSLLGNYLLGYQVSWGGALVGLLEGALGGFAFGYALAHLINFAVHTEETAVRRGIELGELLDPLEGESL